MTHDISVCGVRFATRVPLAVGETIRMIFELGRLRTKPEPITIRTCGRIVRVEPRNTKPLTYEVAVATDEIDFGPAANPD